jgi:UDPglucose--hexose-1-phosphate uridylyltransferase
MPCKQVIEYRMDPLTERWCRINVDRVYRKEQVKTVRVDKTIKSMIKRSAEECCFCVDKIKSSTPMFTQELLEEGRIAIGQSTVFPNLYPFGEHHAVCVIAEKHYMELPEFSSEILRDAFQASILFFKRVYEVDKESRYPQVGFNFMPPAGASIFHPHLQILMDSKPTLHIKREVEASRSYFQHFGRCYWEELVKKEKELEERFIGTSGGFSWISSWAPLGNNEVLGILTEPISCILDIGERGLRSLAGGLSRVLKELWEERGVRSLNLAMYSGPVGEDMRDFFRVFVRIISRPTLRDFYTSDRGFMEILHEETVVETLPESVADDLRRCF